MRKKGLFWSVIILILISIPFILLENNRFQQYLAHHIVQSYNEQHPTKIQVDSVSFSLIHPHIALHHVTTADSTGYVFFAADRMDAEIRLIPLFSGNIDIPHLRLIGVNASVFKENENAEMNINYLIKQLFSKEESGSAPTIILSSVIIKDGAFHYDILSVPPKEAFDASHIAVSKVDAKFSLKISQEQSLCRIHHFAFEGAHGFHWKNLHLDLAYEHDLLSIYSARLDLSESYLQTDSLWIEMPDEKNLSAIRITQPFKMEGRLSTLDLLAFVQNLSFEDIQESIINFSMYTSGTANDINLNDMHLEMDSLLDIEANLWLKELFSSENEASIESYWKKLKINPEIIQWINPFLSTEKIVLPKQIERLGNTTFNGFLTASTKKISMSGDFIAAPGSLSAQANVEKDDQNNYRFDLDAQSDQFNLQTILSTDIHFGESAFIIHANAHKKQGYPISGDIDAKINRFRYNGYTYRNVDVEASCDINGHYTGTVHSKDKNCQLQLIAMMDKKVDKSAILCDLKVKHINLHTLNWMDGKDPNAKLSFGLQAQLNGNNLQDVKGRILIDSLFFYNQQEEYRMKYLSLVKGEENDMDYLLLQSDIAEGWIYGKCDVAQIPNDLSRIIFDKYLPAWNKSGKEHTPSGNQYEFKWTINRLDELSESLSLPFSIPDFALIEGHYYDNTESLSLKVESNEVIYQGQSILSPYLLLNNSKKDHLQMLLLANTSMGGNNMLSLDVEANAQNNKLSLDVKWDDASNGNQGELKTQHSFNRISDKTPLTISSIIQSPNIYVGDSLWMVDPSRWYWDGERLKVSYFQMHHRDQFVKINGLLSKNETDSLYIGLNDINLNDLFKLIPQGEDPFLLGGIITAQGKIVSVLGDPQINADVQVKDFSLNNYIVGDLDGFSLWDKEKKAVVIDAVLNEENQQTAAIYGGYYPTFDSLYLAINSVAMPVNFVSSFTKPTLSLGGRVDGLVEISAPFKKNNIGVRGAAFIEDGMVEIDALKSKFYFNDSIYISPEYLRFKNITLNDAEGNLAYLNLDMRHQYFKNIFMNMRLSANRLKVVDIKPSPSETIYGTVYASGTALLNGPIQDLQLDVNARTDEKTTFTISMLDNSDVNDYTFIQFVDKNASNSDVIEVPIRKIAKDASDFRMNLQIEATPSAEIVLLTNPNTGDAIRGRGTGSIRVSFSQKSDLELYGRYELESGSYEFNIQDIMQKKFDILQGSSVNFSGDPLSGVLDIDATHTVINVSLTDLLDEADITSLNLNRTSIPVNCTLNLSGEIQQPNIQLGLDFPSADEELRRRIMNVVNTDEVLNRQIVYLLLLSRFASSENNTTATTNNNMTAVVGVTLNTLSNQINKMIYQALGTNNLSLDFNYQYEDYGTNSLGEWQVAMTSQLMDNRLIINGNIGSREDLVNDNTQFIGDFDLEYKFSPSGRWRLKMFNRSNDSRYFKSAMTTQGVGVVYKESFNNLSELKQSFIERIAAQVIKSKKEADIQPKARSSKKK